MNVDQPHAVRAGSPTDLFARLLPAGAFTRSIENLVEKDNPDNVIGWPADPVPHWAKGFHPFSIADLGSGLGGETISMLSRLGQWGCLDNLGEVHLFEHDLTLSNGSLKTLPQILKDRVESVLKQYVAKSVNIEVHTQSMKLGKTDGRWVVDPISKYLRQVDLVFASHITYFFDDGSGAHFTDALLQEHLAPEGRLWVNIRDRQCAVYEARAAALVALDIREPQPFDYAEFYRDHVLPHLPAARVLDSSSVSPRLRAHANRHLAAELMMWRTTIDTVAARSAQVLRSATEQASAGDGPLFSETQFILGR